MSCRGSLSFIRFRAVLPVRIPVLVALYFGCMVTARWSLPALAIVGLIESLLSLRARRAAAANVKT